MKYNITINQLAVVNLKLDLDFTDMAIFDFIKDFSLVPSCVKMQTPEGEYFWISHQLIIGELPLLGIKTKQGVIKRVDKLIQAKILVKHPNCSHYGRTLYQFGENFEKLCFVNSPKQELRGAPNESLGTLNGSLGYNKNKNNTIIENIDIEEVFSKSKINDIGIFLNKYLALKEQGIDISYYFYSVKNWSDRNSQIKRTPRGWLATFENFIKKDDNKGVTRYVKQEKATGYLGL